MQTLRIALTPGEPAGIGPDLAVRMAQQAHPHELVVCADPGMLAARASALGLPLKVEAVDYAREPTPAAPGCLRVDAIGCPRPAVAGAPDTGNAAYVLATLERAVALCRGGQCSALVTGPVHKGVINKAGFVFSGHTGYLADLCASPPPVMMLATDDGALRVALATTHIALAEVPKALTRELLTHTLRVTASALARLLAIDLPRLLVAGLNPHAGEQGYLGREEIDVITPVIEAQRARGLRVTGPLPADTLFTPDKLAGADAVVAMYHDQGLPVIKHLGFGRTVNISLGLPIVRTSVDHGTALALAARPGVHTGSLKAAIATAARMAGATRQTAT